MRLRDDVRSLALRLCQNLGALLLGHALRLGDDLVGLLVGVTDRLLVALGLLGRPRLRLGRRIQVVLNLLLALLQHPEDGRPS